MNRIYRALPVGLRERPLDFYAAFVLFLVGVYGIADDRFPERFQQPLSTIFINVISVYLIVAASLVIASLFCNKKKKPIFAHLSELFGWMLICAASIAASLLYVASLFVSTPQSWVVWAVWFCIWLGMAFSSLIRTYDLYIITRRSR